MQTLITPTLLLLGVATVFASVVVLRRDSSSDRGAIFLMAFAISFLLVYEMNVFAAGSTMQLILLLVTCTIGTMLLVIRRDYWRRRLRPACLLPATVSALLFFTNAIMNPSLAMVDLVARAAPVLFWIVVGIVASVATIRERSVAAIGALVLGLSTIASFVGEPWRSCDQFKCGLFGAIFTGPFASENVLAQVAVIAIVLGAVRSAGRLRVLILVLAGLLLVVATSRTAALSLGLALLGGLVLTRIRAQHRSRLVLPLVMGSAAISVLVVTNAAPQDFSNRGGIWRRALAPVEGHELLGVGISRWHQLQQIGLLPPNNFPHNQLLLMFFSAGIVGCVAYLVMLWRMSLGFISSATTATAGSILLIYLLVSGITEIMWNPATVDGHSVAVLAVLLLWSTARGSADPFHSSEDSGHLVGRVDASR